MLANIFLPRLDYIKMSLMMLANISKTSLTLDISSTSFEISLIMPRVQIVFTLQIGMRNSF